MTILDAEDRADTFVPHAFPEQTVDLGEIRMNYAVAGHAGLPALLLVPGQSESWWGYEKALPLLGESFHVHAVDLRGQGRSTWTPGRYTLDNFGNDLVRFIDLVIGRETIVSGLSSGGVLAAWLSAFAKPDQVRGAVYEDPPLFASQIAPAVGHGIRQSIGPLFATWNKWLGDQCSIGDWAGLQRAFPIEMPPEMLRELASMMPPAQGAPPQDGPPQNLREYDPEWGKAFVSGSVATSCDHAAMLAQVKVPVLFTHHFRTVDEQTGRLIGAISDLQVAAVRDLVTAAGQPFDYHDFPTMPHSMHEHDPKLYVETVLTWASTLGPAQPPA